MHSMMKSIAIRNSAQGYGLVAIGLHWMMAVLIIGLFLLGEWMVGLNYYHPWYLKAPDLHRGLGVITAILLCLRLFWRLGNPHPRILGGAWEQGLATWVHWSFYVLTAAITISGYLITTADGQAVAVFDWFEIPASLHGLARQEDIAGEVHSWLATGIMVLTVVHILAALKHHYMDRDATLLRMLWPPAGGEDVATLTSKESCT